MHLIWKVFESAFAVTWSYCAWKGIKEYYRQFRMWELQKQNPNKSIIAVSKNGKVHYFVGEEAYQTWRKNNGGKVR
jgi:hypothetical protein